MDGEHKENGTPAEWTASVPQSPKPEDYAVVVEHYKRMLDHYTPPVGVKIARKHLGWYLDALAPETSLRRDILTADGPETIAALLPEALGEERVLA